MSVWSDRISSDGTVLENTSFPSGSLYRLTICIEMIKAVIEVLIVLFSEYIEWGTGYKDTSLNLLLYR